MAVHFYNNDNPQIAASAYIDKSAVITGAVTIGADSSVWSLVAIRGDMHTTTIGERTNIQDGSVLHQTHAGKFTGDNGYPLIIGDDVTVGHKAILHGCTIKNRVLVGMGSIILDGAIIEDDVIIGAGSLIAPNKKLASGFLYVGSPAKQIRPLTEREYEFLLYSAHNYVALKNSYLNNLHN